MNTIASMSPRGWRPAKPMRALGLIATFVVVPAIASESESSLLIWRGSLVSFHDGDSGRVLDSETGRIEQFRMAGYDTPEISEGRADCIEEQRHAIVAQATASAFALIGPIEIEWRDSDGDGQIDRDRYGRGLMSLWSVGEDGTRQGSLYDRLVAQNLALPYEGGKAPDWCRYIEHMLKHPSTGD